MMHRLKSGFIKMEIMTILLPLLGFFAFVKNAEAFMIGGSVTRTNSMRVASTWSKRSVTLLSTSTSNDEDLLSEIKAMRVREIKQELKVDGVDTSDVFEKDELVKRLLNQRKKKESSAQKDQQQQNTPSRTDHPASSVCVPMDFHSLTPDLSVPSRNSNVFLRPSPGKYPSIDLTVPGQKRPLTLLVDTACSGLVLRPNIIKQYNLPSFNAGVTMTAAGGTVGGTSVAKLSSAIMDDGTVLDDLMVAGQDIGALPRKLDGIIGLSFLNQFQSVAFDFDESKLILSKKKNAESMTSNNNMEVLAKSEMKLCKIGVWTVDVTLDGRGPVKMLVDTGAASSFLNWKGVHSLNMDRDHPLISRNTEALGVMGADNNAFELSHRFVLKRRINLTSDPSSVGVFDPQGIDISEMGSVNIDIGDLPVLDTLKYEEVGGILGSDILMRCDSLHFDFGNSSPNVLMLKK